MFLWNLGHTDKVLHSKQPGRISMDHLVLPRVGFLLESSPQTVEFSPWTVAFPIFTYIILHIISHIVTH